MDTFNIVGDRLVNAFIFRFAPMPFHCRFGSKISADNLRVQPPSASPLRHVNPLEWAILCNLELSSRSLFFGLSIGCDRLENTALVMVVARVTENNSSMKRDRIRQGTSGDVILDTHRFE